MLKNLIVLTFVLCSLSINVFATKEYIGSQTATVNVDTETTITVGARGIYYINTNLNDIYIKWPNANSFELFRGVVLVDPQTTFEYGDEIKLKAYSATHNAYIGIYRER